MNILEQHIIADAVNDIHAAIQASPCAACKDKPTPVYGIPTGGLFVAYILATLHPGKYLVSMTPPSNHFRSLEGNTVAVVDDLLDSGATIQPFLDEGRNCFALYAKPSTPIEIYTRFGFDAPCAIPHRAVVARMVEGWVKFPWERDSAPQVNVERLLQYIGEDPLREGLRETPARVCKALHEMTRGMDMNPAEILSKQFTCASDNIVICRGLRFASMCEHHLLPFTGVAHVGYLPKGTVVGLSKLARLVDCFANRLQLQEQMTNQIASALMTCIPHCDGAGAIVIAHHSCMGCRGVRKHDAEMVTSSMLGAFRTDASARAEFTALCKL